MKVKKGDTVLVIAGKDKGAKGKVLKAYPERSRVLVILHDPTQSAAIQAVAEAYRARFRPGVTAAPRFMLAVNLFAAETDAGQVVTLHVDVGVQQAADVLQLLDGGGQHRQRDTGELL